MAKKKSTKKKSSTASRKKPSKRPAATKPRARKSPSRKGSSATGDMRQRVHQLTLAAVRDGELTLRDLPKLAKEVIEEAAAGLNKAVPQSSRNVLRQVVDGLTDAAAATAHSTKVAVSSMASRGSDFIKKDAAKTVKDLRELEGNFVTALEKAGKSLKGAAKDEMEAIVRNARRAGTRIKPAAESTIKAVDGHVVELTKETAKAGVRATRSAVGSFLHGASGMLQGLGDAVSESKQGGKKRKPVARRR
jgi:hypothetical protein